MLKRRRPLLGDLCVCALVATAGAVGLVLAKEYMEDMYFRAGIYFPLPLPTLLLTQLSLGCVAGLIADVAGAAQ